MDNKRDLCMYCSFLYEASFFLDRTCTLDTMYGGENHNERINFCSNNLFCYITLGLICHDLGMHGSSLTMVHGH